MKITDDIVPMMNEYTVQLTISNFTNDVNEIRVIPYRLCLKLEEAGIPVHRLEFYKVTLDRTGPENIQEFWEKKRVQIKNIVKDLNCEYVSLLDDG